MGATLGATRAGADQYVMGRTAEEYERLRQQARIWERATAALIEATALGSGARCLDVGCGPGETMRLMAERVGPGGRVVGLDTDADVGRAAIDALRAAGHDQCAFVAGDVTGDLAGTDEIPDGGFDLVFGRLILLHLPDPVAALRRMWSWTAPGGHLVIQDYDMRVVDAYPPLTIVDEWKRVFLGTFDAVGRDVRLGHRLPTLFAEAGIGAPDATDVVGRLEPLERTAGMLAATYRSVAPIAVAHGLITEHQRDQWLADLADTAETHADHSLIWPLLIGARKQRPVDAS
jgi:ubiquinone/menaquinone biosynthesis C-methylase UbiE